MLIKSFPVRAIAVWRTLKTASRAAWVCTHLFNANSALAPRGPAKRDGNSSCTIVRRATAVSSKEKRTRGVPAPVVCSVAMRERRSEIAAWKSASCGVTS
jgi:hypothetical protein